MNRYEVLNGVNPREIVLLRGRPCAWGRCLFCDYIDDNTTDVEEMIAENDSVLAHVTGLYASLEVINSGSVFELPRATWETIRTLCRTRGITKLCFEVYYNYRHRLEEVRTYFEGIEVSFKCGIETFDETFRNEYLQKGIVFRDAEEVATHFNQICLLVGVRGQTRDMIDYDIELALTHFERVCINVFVENTTPVQRDEELVDYVRAHYGHLERDPRVEILWHNTDFGVGGYYATRDMDDATDATSGHRSSPLRRAHLGVAKSRLR